MKVRHGPEASLLFLSTLRSLLGVKQWEMICGVSEEEIFFPPAVSFVQRCL